MFETPVTLCDSTTVRYFPREHLHPDQKKLAGNLIPLLVLADMVDRLANRDNHPEYDRLPVEPEMVLPEQVCAALAVMGVKAPGGDSCTLTDIAASIEQSIRPAAKEYFAAVTGLDPDMPVLRLGYRQIQVFTDLIGAQLYGGRIWIVFRRETNLRANGTEGVDRGYSSWLLPRGHYDLLAGASFATQAQRKTLYRAAKAIR